MPSKATYFLLPFQPCRRQRNVPENQSPYFVNPNSVELSPSKVKMILDSKDPKSVPLSFTLHTLADGMLRIRADEANPLEKRYEIPMGDVLVSEPIEEKYVIFFTMFWLICDILNVFFNFL